MSRKQSEGMSRQIIHSLRGSTSFDHGVKVDWNRSLNASKRHVKDILKAYMGELRRTDNGAEQP